MNSRKPTAREVDPKDVEFGRRVKKLREERKLTQLQFAAMLEKTGSWVSQIERGIQPVTRIDTLQALADALSVPVQRLRPGTPTPSAPAEIPQPMSYTNDLEGAAQLISGHPALGTLLGTDSSSGPVSLDDLRTEVDEIWELTHADEYAAVSESLEDLLPTLERAVRVVDQEQRPEAYSLLARTYQALAAAFVRQGLPSPAWVAADRAISAAERSGDPLSVCAGIFRMVQAFVRNKELGQAAHAARTATLALSARDDLGPKGLSVLGALHLTLALVSARSAERAEAKEEIQKAREIAAQIGEDRNDFNLEFGPTNVEIHAVSIAVELGDAGEAVDIGLSIDAESLSPERQGRLLMDLGRAYAQRRRIGEATDCLLRAEALTPQMIRTHGASRAAIKDLALMAGDEMTADLAGLAERADAMP
ncbi:helix-turn-helix domain-containing protein [Streptomyces nigrescens]|uniref:helix-turn-helix domain-containing protein n=1 Tax=Streptomyces nigrescens TaxID=1920 RepID=UPI0036F86DF9